MPLHFTCPHCNSQTIVEDQFLGQSGPCFTCGKNIVVPYSPTTGGATAVAVKAPAARGASLAVLIAIIAASLVAGGAMLVLLIALIAPAVTAARSAAQSSSCGNNLLQIGKALDQYHQKYGSYPPAVTTDKSGKPMHSWRVLILPFCGHSQLYSEYDMTQPWDSPANLRVANRMPEIFACPSDADARPKDETSYMVVIGPLTAFPGPDKSTSRTDFQDGFDKTVLVVESATKGVSWTKPEDLDANRLTFAINSGNSGSSGLGSGHEGGMHVLTASGIVHFVIDTANKEFVEALTTIASNDDVDWSLIEDTSGQP